YAVTTIRLFLTLHYFNVCKIPSVPVPSVTVNVSGTDLVEFNSSVSLSCSSSGSSLSFLWLNGSSLVTATDRVQLLNLNRTITIVNVSRYDQGPFSCRVSSAVSSGTSEPVKLSISYGADNVGISGPRKLEVEQTLVLFCSAESSPPADYTWTLNGKEMLNNSAVFIKHVTQCSDSGKYVCQARNQLTGRTSLREHSVSVQACGLSPAAITRIVIACVLVFGGVLAGGLCICWIKSKSLYIRRSESSAQPRQPEHKEQVYENNFVGLQASSVAPKTSG
ncbi:carcinoembryonic antigen-related cell adhesion molecule 6-like, partial [Betta splendens]|uniref:Carcinoembryonic antigen-related cell adhesion molecule 6-like n=1 Tax=Betta splendens TaxID=158456 RepID=A0A8M1H5T6_BETSP